MNIFATSPDPVACAAFLDDKRVVKMCLETAQMISTAARVLYAFADIFDAPLLKPAYAKHPCTLWAMADIKNFKWLSAHGRALCELYTKVYGKVHKNSDLFDYFDWHDNVETPDSFVNCTRNQAQGVDFRHIADTHTAYQLYLTQRWLRDTREPTWTGRNRPAACLLVEQR
jgi:hypothetical protein